VAAVELRVVLVNRVGLAAVEVVVLLLEVLAIRHQQVHLKVITAVQVLRFLAQTPAAVVVDGAR
jgi:hypothetical protein